MDDLKREKISLFDIFLEMEFGLMNNEKISFDLYFFYSMKDLRFLFSEKILEYVKMNYPSKRIQTNFLIQKKKN